MKENMIGICCIFLVLKVTIHIKTEVISLIKFGQFKNELNWTAYRFYHGAFSLVQPRVAVRHSNLLIDIYRSVPVISDTAYIHLFLES